MAAPTITEFRLALPEFWNATAFPDAMIALWLSVAALRLPEDRWKTLYPIGCILFTAHNLALSDQAQKAAAASQTPGASAGAVASKAVDKVSVSYDTGSAAHEGAGHYNLTSYGQRFWELAEIIGIGGMQL